MNAERFEQWATTHEAVLNPFFGRARTQPWTASEVRAFMPEYYAWVRAFPRMLAGLMAKTKDEELLAELASILFSELGSGHPEAAHFRLLERVLEDCGMSREEWMRGPARRETRELLNGLEEAYGGRDYDLGLGAQYALELQADLMLKNLWQGLTELLGGDPTKVPYFRVHAVEEPGHANSMRRAVSRRLTQGGSEGSVQVGASRCLELIAGLWRGCAALQVSAREGAAR